MKTLILGSSPNAFSAALTLAEAGHSVQMVECASHFGAPYHTLEGGEVGLAYVHFCSRLARQWGFSLTPLRHPGRTGIRGDGSWLRVTPTSLEGTPVPADVQRWPHFVTLLDQAARLLSLMLHSPDRPADLNEQWRALGRRTSMEVLRLPWMSLRDLLDEWFQDETLKGILAETALEGVAQGPFASGTVFHLLVRWARGEALRPATVGGGSSSLIQALRKAAEERGVKIGHCPGQPQLSWSEGRPSALSLGEHHFDFDQLLSDKDVRWTYTQLVSPRYLETEFNTALHHVRGRGVWQRALGRCDWPAEWPEVSRADILHVQPGLRSLEKAYDRLKRNQDSQGPVQLCWPGQLDPSRPQNLVQESFGYGSGSLLPQVTDRSYYTAVDYEQDWQCPQGHLWGGETDLSQSFFLRPIPAYEPEVAGVDLCGASLHPADYSGRAGRWAAQKLLIS